jgi:hypothetical protein
MNSPSIDDMLTQLNNSPEQDTQFTLNGAENNAEHANNLNVF